MNAAFQINTLCFTGANEGTGSEFKILISNPINDFAKILIPKSFQNNITLNVCDVLGRVIYSKQIAQGFSGELNIPTVEWERGTYLFSILSSDQTKTFKIVKY
jgi:hypothetical protein